MKKLKNIQDPSFFLALETGTFTNISGFGKMFNKFLETKKLTGYSGEDSMPSNPKDGNFWRSKLRHLPFDHTFTFLPIDVDKCMCL